MYFGLDFEPPGWLGAAVLACAAGLGLFGRKRPGLFVAALALGVAAAGFTAGQVRTATVAAPILEKRLGPVGLSGQVLDMEPRVKNYRIILHRLEIRALSRDKVPERVRVVVFGEPNGVRPGDWIRLRAVLRPPPGPAAPGAFDFARRAFYERLGGVGFAIGRAIPAASPIGVGDGEASAVTAWRLWWTDLRLGIARRILAVLPGEAGAVAAALMTGERGAT